MGVVRIHPRLLLGLTIVRVGVGKVLWTWWHLIVSTLHSVVSWSARCSLIVVDAWLWLCHWYVGSLTGVGLGIGEHGLCYWCIADGSHWDLRDDLSACDDCLGRVVVRVVRVMMVAIV